MLITDIENTGVGDQVLINNTGNFNTAAGFGSLQLNTTGNDNTAMGDRALQSNTTGRRHTAVGSGALQNCVAPPDFAGNTAVGRKSALQRHHRQLQYSHG